jgi:DNA-binding transcriptional MerR regulator
MSLSTEEVNERIANGRRVVQEADEALERGKRFFAENNIDPKEIEEFMRNNASDPVVQKVEAQIKAEIEQIQEETQRRRMHAPKARTAGQRPRIRNNMI